MRKWCTNENLWQVESRQVKHTVPPLFQKKKKRITRDHLRRNQSKYNHSFLPWSADELLESPRGHPNHLKNTICYLLSLKRCLDFFHCLNVTLSTSFPVIFHSISRLGFFLVVVPSQSKWSLRDPANYPFPLSQAIISLLHLGLTSWAQLPSTYNYVKTGQDLRSGGLKGAQIWGEEAAGLSDT